jgi:thiol-disulfide isomerase/thioredoxin
MRLSRLYGALVLLLAASFALGEDRSSAASFSPSCPEAQIVAGKYQFPALVFRYNPSAPDAELKSPGELNLRIADLTFLSGVPVQSVPMTKQPDGTWSTKLSLNGLEVSYFVFYFEDGLHRVDRNHGNYWDILGCTAGEPSAVAVMRQAMTWQGKLTAPGIERPLSLDRAIAILRDDLTRFPDHTADYGEIWIVELEQAGKTQAAFQQVASEIDRFLAAHGTDYDDVSMVCGVVAASQDGFPASTVAGLRQAVVNLPETAEAFVWNRGRKQPVPRDTAWHRRMEKTMHDRLLAELDLWPAQNEPNDEKRVSLLLAYAASYSGSAQAGTAYLEAFTTEERLKNVPGAERVEAAWSAWDSKSPDPPAVLAHFYLNQKVKLDQALVLLNQAQALFDAGILALNDPAASRNIDSFGKSRAIREVGISPRSKGRIEFLRAQVELLSGDLPRARADFDAAEKAMAGNPEVEYAAGQAREKMGDLAPALDAYLAAASVLYTSALEAQPAYERVFVKLKRGSIEAADRQIEARIREAQKKVAAEYVPVRLNQAAPEFSFHAVNGRLVDNAAEKGRYAVINFWSVGCAPCRLELPGLLDFKRAHPKVDVTAVAIDDNPRRVRDYLVAHNLGALQVAVVSDLPSRLATGWPTTLVFDGAGKLQFVHKGLMPDVEAILDKDLELLQ